MSLFLFLRASLSSPSPSTLHSLTPLLLRFRIGRNEPRCPGFLFESSRQTPSFDGFSLFFSLSLWRRIRLESSENEENIFLFRTMSPRSSQLFSACSWRVLKGNRLRYSSGHCGIERGLENNERRGCQRSTDIFFRPIDSQSASVPPFPASIFARSVELALIFTSCDCKNGEPFGERCMLKICRVAITG